MYTSIYIYIYAFVYIYIYVMKCNYLCVYMHTWAHAIVVLCPRRGRPLVWALGAGRMLSMLESVRCNLYKMQSSCLPLFSQDTRYELTYLLTGCFESLLKQVSIAQGDYYKTVVVSMA